jgi:hypothetical protein
MRAFRASVGLGTAPATGKLISQAGHPTAGLRSPLALPYQAHLTAKFTGTGEAARSGVGLLAAAARSRTGRTPGGPGMSRVPSEGEGWEAPTLVPVVGDSGAGCVTTHHRAPTARLHTRGTSAGPGLSPPVAAAVIGALSELGGSSGRYPHARPLR